MEYIFYKHGDEEWDSEADVSEYEAPGYSADEDGQGSEVLCP